MTLHEHESSAPARVVVIDDDEDFRDFIELMLEEDDRFTVVGTAADGAEGVTLTDRLEPDVIVLDLQMPVLDGMQALPLLRRRAPDARIVVVSAFPDLVTLMDVLDRGADLYLDKGRAWEEVVPALVAAGPGEITTL